MFPTNEAELSTIEFYRGVPLDENFKKFYIRDENQTRAEWEAELEQYRIPGLQMSASSKQRLDRPILIRHIVEDFQNTDINFVKITNRSDGDGRKEAIFYAWVRDFKYLNSQVTAVSFGVDDFYTAYWAAKDVDDYSGGRGILFGNSLIERAHYRFDYGDGQITDPHNVFKNYEAIESGEPQPIMNYEINNPNVAFFIIPYAPSISDATKLPNIGQGLASSRAYIAIAFNPMLTKMTKEGPSPQIYDMIDANTGTKFYTKGTEKVSTLSEIISLLMADPQWSSGGEFMFGGAYVKQDIGYPYSISGNTMTIGSKNHTFVTNNEYDIAYRQSCTVGLLPYLANAPFGRPFVRDYGSSIYKFTKQVIEQYMSVYTPNELEQMYAENGDFLEKLTHFVSLSISSGDGIINSFQIPDITGTPNDTLSIHLVTSANEGGRVGDFFVFPFITPNAGNSGTSTGFDFSTGRQIGMSRRAVAQASSDIPLVLNQYNAQMYSQQNSNKQAIANIKLGETMTNKQNAQNVSVTGMQNKNASQNLAIQNAQARNMTAMNNEQSLGMTKQTNDQALNNVSRQTKQGMGMGALRGAAGGMMFGLPGMIGGALMGAGSAGLQGGINMSNAKVDAQNAMSNAQMSANNATANTAMAGNNAAELLSAQNAQAMELANNNANFSDKLAAMAASNAVDNLTAGYNDLKLQGGVTVSTGGTIEYLFQTSQGQSQLIAAVPNSNMIKRITQALVRLGSTLGIWGNPADFMFTKSVANYIQCSQVTINSLSNISQNSKANIMTILESGATIWHDLEKMNNEDYTGNNWK